MFRRSGQVKLVSESAVLSVTVTNSTLSYADSEDRAESAITAPAVQDALDLLLTAGKQIASLLDVAGLEFGEDVPPPSDRASRGELR